MVVIFWQWAYFQLKGHYSGLSEARREVSVLRDQVVRASVRTELVQYQFDLFRQQVAKTIPELKIQSDPTLQSERRALASVVQQPSEEFLILAQFESSVDDLRVMFEKQHYKQVIRKAKNLLAIDPVSPNLVSVYFMLAESYYQNNELDACLATAQTMTHLFPEHSKTGYVLLRVGLFLKEKNRLEEARNMFSLVAHAFSADQDLQKQSQRLLASTGSVE